MARLLRLNQMYGREMRNVRSGIFYLICAVALMLVFSLSHLALAECSWAKNNIDTSLSEVYGVHVYDVVKAITTALPDTTPPTVSSTSPVNSAIRVVLYTTVTVTFDMAMDASTITTSSFTLDSVSGSVSYNSGTYTATFTPSAMLERDTTYTAQLSTAITSAVGIPLAVVNSWSFTTVYPGDNDGNGIVNALDITGVEKIIAGVDAQRPGADANQDGSVNALDITKTERIAAGLD